MALRPTFQLDAEPYVSTDAELDIPVSERKSLLDLVEAELEVAPVGSRGDRRQAVQQGIDAYDKALRLPMWLAEVVGWIVQRFGPQGLEYGRFSIDSHFTRNALWLRRPSMDDSEAIQRNMLCQLLCLGRYSVVADVEYLIDQLPGQ